jgi:EAL domain-containing protein (putative c-di-GMP-specific phosphodiesterase class I)
VRRHGDMRLVSTISQALNDGRFELYAQPIAPVAPSSGSQNHFEVLVRMLDGSGEQLIPDRFIPAAERYILMPAVDRWVINRLFSLQAENLRTWHASASEGFLFAVNLSGTSVTDEGFLRYLKRQFIDWDVPPSTICFEITETAAIRNLASARAFMQELTALGCTFALDDFGSGLSSYGYLKELPVDYLKIDGSFVRGMAEDPVSYALVESINQIGHVLGLKTIAEWAEDKNILNQLRALNVDFAQGFGVGKAIAITDLALADATAPLIQSDKLDAPQRDPQRTPRNLARPA